MGSAIADSNILLRLMQPAHPEHAIAAAAVDKLMERRTDLCIMRQNLIEFWAVATRPRANRGFGLKPDVAGDLLTRLRSTFHLLEGATGVADRWQKLVKEHAVVGKQAHDAHLVAAMRAYGINQILTFNADDFKRFDVEIIEPATIGG